MIGRNIRASTVDVRTLLSEDSLFCFQDNGCLHDASDPFEVTISPMKTVRTKSIWLRPCIEAESEQQGTIEGILALPGPEAAQLQLTRTLWKGVPKGDINDAILTYAQSKAVELEKDKQDWGEDDCLQSWRSQYLQLVRDGVALILQSPQDEIFKVPSDEVLKAKMEGKIENYIQEEALRQAQEHVQRALRHIVWNYESLLCVRDAVCEGKEFVSYERNTGSLCIGIASGSLPPDWKID